MSKRDRTLGYEERSRTETASDAPVDWRGLLAIAQGPETFATRYRLGGEIGRGGVGRVLAADDRVMGRSVAIKALHEGRGREDYSRRFFAEVQTTAQL